jgi:hypothetical protein
MSQLLAPPPTDEQIEANKQAALVALLMSFNQHNYRQPNWLAAHPFDGMEGYYEDGGVWRKSPLA